MLSIAITGANSGIGLRAARALAAAGHHVLALCRDPDRGRAALADINAHAAHPADLIQADLSAPGSIKAAAEQLAETTGHLDVLINNSAVFDQTLRTPLFTADGHELFWAVNHLGPFLLTAHLSRLLAAADNPRVINVASKGLISMPRIRIRFGQLDDPSWYSPTRAYYHAKLAQIMTTFTLAEKAGGNLETTCVRVPAVRLDPDRVAAMPWLARTLYAPKNRMAVPAERLGETYARLATWDGNLPGPYVDEDLRPVRGPAFAYDEAARERLWSVSQAATGDPAWAW
ncbi:SDR family NAD(P)-dependent oxidoreductase [Nonomuraea deserti]|uniref:SDR family NAD(P)-dependent oxidoreductase n=1 Tax=Nonomuraea deserti TaxID=1848322 RepID=A0A4R4VKZ1_9ACTN|nr:SDR family NAD(P)-dependent oxidoreductase [Nonomuraea deserti]TDD02845.1 SDR family NAD(P)-dependent oxidoreductase [Nonomuraea deserti]